MTLIKSIHQCKITCIIIRASRIYVSKTKLIFLLKILSKPPSSNYKATPFGRIINSRIIITFKNQSIKIISKTIATNSMTMTFATTLSIVNIKKEKSLSKHSPNWNIQPSLNRTSHITSAPNKHKSTKSTRNSTKSKSPDNKTFINHQTKSSSTTSFSKEKSHHKTYKNKVYFNPKITKSINSM